MPGKTGKPGKDTLAPDLVIQVLYRKHDTALWGTRLSFDVSGCFLVAGAFAQLIPDRSIGIQPGFQQPLWAHFATACGVFCRMPVFVGPRLQVLGPY